MSAEAGVWAALDPRIHAYDAQMRVAETALLDRLDGGFHFIRPEAAWNGPARLSLRARPEESSPQVSEALPGEPLEVLLTRPDGWVWLRTVSDGYLGYARVNESGKESSKAIRSAPASQPLSVTALRGHVYAEPRISAQVVAEVCLGAVLERGSGEVVTDKQRRWVPVGGGWLHEACLQPLPDPDPAALALRFLGTPYVWGGRSAWGLDCSGLAQLVFGAFGRALPRDADMQQAFLPVAALPQRGDLAFFPGHVGIMLGGHQMVHANSTAMSVSTDTLGEGEYGARLQAELLGFGRWEA